MILRRPSDSDDKTTPTDSEKRKSEAQKAEGMGQFSSSEVPAAMVSATGKAAVSLQQASSSTTTTMRPVKVTEEKVHGTPLPIRPSKPIDIRGPHHRSVVVPLHPHHIGGGQRMLQRSVSEMGGGQQHQPRVIQPRRLTTTTTTTSTLGPMATSSASVAPVRRMADELGGMGLSGQMANSSGQQRQGRHGPRRSRGFTVDIPVHQQLVVMDPECHSASIEEMNDKNNDKENGKEVDKGGNHKLSRSRKRVNSAKLEYDALEGTSSEGVEKTTQKEEEERAETERMEVGEEQKQQEENNGMGGGGGGRRKPAEQGGRIAYLYGVYGASDTSDPCASAQQPNRNTFADQANILAWNSSVCSDDCCCFEEDDEGEEDGNRDELARTKHCMVHSLHTVSDIIGYAKVVRAQRNETLGRLNDVMSQFDALIRSYSKAMRSVSGDARSAQQGTDGVGGANGGGGSAQCQTQLEGTTMMAQ